jgi:hypothetical protein
MLDRKYLHVGCVFFVGLICTMECLLIWCFGLGNFAALICAVTWLFMDKIVALYFSHVVPKIFKKEKE